MLRTVLFRRMITVLLLLAILVFACSSASANSWGLNRGRLLNAVAKDHTWDNYSTSGGGTQAGDYAVMSARYHSALFFADSENQLHVYTKAVYQPEDKAKGLKLTMKNGILTLAYGDAEVYCFSDGNGDEDLDLLEAKIGDFRLWRDDNGYSYYAEDKDGRVVFNGWNPLSEFNIRLFPRSTAEIRRINLLTAYLGDTHELSSGYPINPGKKGTAPVYAAPFGKSAWRAAKGKAAAGLNGDMWAMEDWKNNDGDTYTLIRYDVSERTQRVGWVLSRELGREEKQQQEHDPLYDFCQVDVWAIADTYLTDDPDVSQFRQFEVPKETCFTCLGTYKGYAYVEAEVNKKGKFTDGGAIVWGFVPLRDLEIMDPGEEKPEIMKKLVGTWYMNGGGEFMPDVMTFAEDGTYTTNTEEWVHDLKGETLDGHIVGGTWKVINYRTRWNLFWDQPDYALLVMEDNGTAGMYGLSFEEEGFGLTLGEGSCGFSATPPEWYQEQELGEDEYDTHG